MIRLLNIAGLMLMPLVFLACDIRLGEDPCPNVNIKLFAEVFQNPEMEDPLHKTEANFYSRIGHLEYMLYKDGVLVDHDKFDVSGTAPSHLLPLIGLPYGDYALIVVGNCKNNKLEGNLEDICSLKLRYPGWRSSEDFFYRLFHFSVDSEEDKEYDLGLYRAHGFVRVSFVNMPEFINKFQIRIGNVTQAREIEKRTFITRHDEATSFDISNSTNLEEDCFIVGTFPSLKSSDALTTAGTPIYIDLFHDGDPDTPYYTECAGTDLEIVRNHLLNLRLIFNDGETSFDISLDTDWDGTLFPGDGGVEID
ncbi:hypothetical protein LJC45_00240 [Alistipes sp. OttesenSCG-928-B03]|nr:hypothetical protein [Alistipes sp. OttesenSCG-928-B03]